MQNIDKNIASLAEEAIELLKKLILIPSLSKEEDGTAAVIESYLNDKGVRFQRKGNNIFARNLYFDESKPTILLNSHHDTVKPGPGWTTDPFLPIIESGKLTGLGSNDAGGCLVSLLATFMYFYEDKNLSFNLVFAATAEEEISGINGVESILTDLGLIEVAIVGEPTRMQMAIAEKGLLVLDCISNGQSGHAARDEGENAIYKSIKDIEWFRDFRFEKVSPFLGPVKMTVTMIKAGEQHNIIPGDSHFTVDIRLNECYTHEEILDVIRENVSSEIHPRSTRIKPSSISIEHPLVQSGLSAGLMPFGSPTTSDQALMPFPSVKIGPGDSARSHTSNEYIYLDEIRSGIAIYIKILETLNKANS